MDIIAARVSNLLKINSLVSRWPLLIGVTLVVSACGGSASGSTETDVDTGIAPVSNVETVDSDRFVLEVQPIRVCDDGGIVCAQANFFEAITDKIWEQADIDVRFLPLNQLNSSTYLSTTSNEFADLSFSGGPGAFGRNPASTSTQGPINLWFVDEIESSAGLLQFGNAWVGFNGVVISDDIFSFNNGAGRIDVIAHELGHNLGLRHTTFGAGPANNLLSSGAVRTVPTTINDIFPDGNRLSQLTSQQITQAQSSGFVRQSAADVLPVVPVPVTPADDVTVQLVSTQTDLVDVPEGSPSFVTWLLLLPLGQRIYRRISR